MNTRLLIEASFLEINPFDQYGVELGKKYLGKFNSLFNIKIFPNYVA